MGSMSDNLQCLGRGKEAISRVWSRRPLGEGDGHFPSSPGQDPEPSGRWDSGHAYGGNTLLMFIDVEELTLPVGRTTLQPEVLYSINMFASSPSISLLWV